MKDPTENPFPESPGAEEYAREQVRKAIDSWCVAEEFKNALRIDEDRFIEKRREHARESTHFYGGQLGWTSWVVKNEDLNLIGQLAPAAIGITTFLATPAAPFAVMAVGLAMSMLSLGAKFRNKSAFLEPSDYSILMMLKQTGPCTVSKLANNLSGSHIFGNDVWDEERTLCALNRMKNVRQGDGSVTELVAEGGDGLWSVSGI